MEGQHVEHVLGARGELDLECRGLLAKAHYRPAKGAAGVPFRDGP